MICASMIIYKSCLSSIKKEFVASQLVFSLIFLSKKMQNFLLSQQQINLYLLLCGEDGCCENVLCFYYFSRLVVCYGLIQICEAQK